MSLFLLPAVVCRRSTLHGVISLFIELRLPLQLILVDIVFVEFVVLGDSVLHFRCLAREIRTVE